MYRNWPPLSSARSNNRYSFCTIISARAVLAILLVTLVTPIAIPAQVNVEITPPRLQDGMAQLEARAAVEINAAAARTAEFVNAIVRKPSLFRALGDANAGASALGSAGGPGGATGGTDSSTGEAYQLTLGTRAAIAAERLNVGVMEARLDRFQETDDIYLGAAAHPWVLGFAFPLQRLLPGLRMATEVGYFSNRIQEFGVTSYTLSLSGSYPVLGPRHLGRYFTYTGVAGSAGVAVGHNSIAGTISPGRITEEFTVDPDGEGPLPGQEVGISVEPEIAADLRTISYVVSLGVSTGIDFLRFLTLTTGVSGDVVTGNSELRLSGDDPIELEGYLSGLLAEDGESRLVISGGTEPVSPTLLQLGVSVALSWRVSTYVVTVPVTWRNTNSVSAGVLVGVVF